MNRDDSNVEKELRERIAASPQGAAGAFDQLAVMLQRQLRYRDVCEVLEEQVRALGASALVYCRLGIARYQLAQIPEAIEAFEKSIAIEGDYALAHYGLAFALLMKGEYERGWKEYEWRWKWRRFRTPWMELPGKVWRGEDLRGRTIVAWAEQGYGDTIQFSRYATVLAEQYGAGKVYLIAPAEVAVVLRSIEGVAGVITDLRELPGGMDFHVPMMNLPLVCGTRVETIPNRVPYLKAEEERIRKWGSRMVVGPGVKRVGLAWSGSPGNMDTAVRACRLKELEPLARAGVQFYSLQKGPGAEEIAEAPRSMGLIDLAGELEDFGDTAGVMENLDLVISTDTVVPHLAGAMGKRVWVMLAQPPDFRWFLEREDSPWYPTARLFRQRTAGVWGDVIERVAGELEKVLI